MTGADIIYEVSVDLNDQEPGYEYTRWPVHQLQSYLREALLYVGKRMQDWFIERVILTVEPGADWQTGCPDGDIIRIIGESNKNGALLRTLRRVDDDDSAIWPSESFRCVQPGNYKMESYSVSATDSSMYKVYPPVPYGGVRYVLAECYTEPDGGLTTSVNAQAVAIVKQWMLYRALSMDSENNPTIVQLAQEHKKTFFDLLNLVTQTELLETADDSSVRQVRNRTSS